jgi:hypothetical protein
MNETHIFMIANLAIFSMGGFYGWKMLRELHLTMNSRLDELLKATKSLARAEGFKAGQEDHLQALKEFKE